MIIADVHDCAKRYTISAPTQTGALSTGKEQTLHHPLNQLIIQLHIISQPRAADVTILLTFSQQGRIAARAVGSTYIERHDEWR